MNQIEHQKKWTALNDAKTFAEVMRVWEQCESQDPISQVALGKALHLAKTRRQVYQAFVPAKRDSELARQAAKALEAFPRFDNRN